MFGVINYYQSTSGEGTDRLFELLQQAKATSPDNASLYYVEGQAYKQIGDLDKAAKAYDKSAAKDPKYVFAYIGKGQMYYDKALELQEKAQNELDDNKSIGSRAGIRGHPQEVYRSVRSRLIWFARTLPSSPPSPSTSSRSTIVSATRTPSTRPATRSTTPF